MAEDNRIEIVARLDTSRAAVIKIEGDLNNIADKLSADKALRIVANLDLTKTTQRIQSQLATISKNLTLNIPKIDANIDTTSANKSVGTIATVYAEGAKQSEILHLKQERLQQDYDILVAKIQKTKLALDSLATRDGVNYNEVFTGIMSRNIVDETSLNRARDALSAIRKEFQLANAQMTSDIPQNAIENFIQRIAKADSQIKILTVDYQKLNNVPQNLKDSFSELQRLAKDFDFSTDFQAESKDSINAKIQDYTKIKVALNETQALLKVAQKEEADFNREFAKELQIEERINKEKEKAFNKEFDKDLKTEEREVELKQKELELIRQIKNEQSQTYGQSTNDYWRGNFNEQSQRDYWDSKRSETIKAMTAESQILKDMKKYYEDYNRAVKQDSALETHRNRIEKLSATMSVFAEKNERAIRSTQAMSSGKTFAQEWQELSNALTKGDLTSDELRHLQERFTIFGKEAEAAGLKGKTAWEKFLGTFKTFSSYITANMVFNVFKRQISSMVQEVISLDSAMTELRKVTEATEPEFNKFLETAKQSAQYLGSSVTDLVDATSTFSRLGYTLKESQTLGEVATLYKNVGDGIDITTASEAIVSSLRAFNGEVSDAISYVDKFNEVSNNFGIESGGIGDALMRSASALAAANNTIDEAIALNTVANEVVNNPDVVANGWRTVALRIRGRITCLHIEKSICCV